MAIQKAKALFRKAMSFLWRYKFSLLLIAYIFLISIYPVDYALSKPILLSCITILFISNILAKSNVYIRWICNVLLIAIITLNAYVALTYSSWVSYGIFFSIFNTTLAETSSVILDQLPIIGVLIIVNTTLIVLSEKELKVGGLSLRYSVIILSVYCFIFLPIVYFWKVKTDDRNITTFWKIQRIVNMHAPVLYGNMSTLILYVSELVHVSRLKDTPKEIPEGMRYNPDKDSPDKIFFVIGESGFRGHISLYGYPVNTTPFVDSLAQAVPKQLSYFNGVAPSNYTHIAIPFLLTFASPIDMSPIETDKTLLDMAKVAGYEVVWISNQLEISPSGGYVGYVASGADIIQADINIFAPDDLNLIPSIYEYMDNDKKQFFIVHLTGSHYNYNDKYDKFDAEAIPGGYADTAVVDYDRSLYHTDRVLREIYKIASSKGQSSFIYYAPDHGEMVGMGIIGVGLGHGPWKDGKAQFEVPVIAISTNACHTDSIIQKYVDDETSLISTSSTSYILSEIMGFTILEEKVAKSRSEGKYVYYSDGTYRLFSDVKEKPENI